VAEQPHWSPFAAAEDWEWFEAEVDGILGRMGEDHRWREGFIEIRRGGWPHTLGIVPIGKDLHERIDRDAWPTELDRRIRDAIAAVEDRDAVPTWDVVQSQLYFRIRPLTEAPRSHMVVGKQVADDLIALIVIDDGKRVRTLDGAYVEAWGSGLKEVHDLAKANTLAAPDLVREDFTHTGGAQLTIMSTPLTTYGAAQVLWPEHWVGELGEHGALVAVPNRQICALHRIGDGPTADVLEWARDWIDAKTRVGGAISPHFYWWRSETDVVRLPDDRFAAVLGARER
jgi:hypothetical protein